MTIGEAINECNMLQPNTYDDLLKVKWLSRCETLVDQSVIQLHEDAGEKFRSFVPEECMHRELIVPEPYDALYVHWLEAQIHYANGEYERYNNAMSMFNANLDGFRLQHSREHRPLQYGRFRF